MRPSSAAFDDNADGSMSVVLYQELLGSGRQPDSILLGHENFGLVAFTAGLARECNQAVVRDPLPTEPAHALVVGKKTGSAKKRMCRGSRWVIQA